MKLLVLTAIVAAVASSPLAQTESWPWQVGKEYTYNVDSYTWTKFEQSDSSGNAFKSQFIVRVLTPGRLVAKLQDPLYAKFQGEINWQSAPKNLQFELVQKFDQPFEILVDGGRVLSVNVPSNLPTSFDNLLKGLISALQVDLSVFGHVHNFPNSFDKESFQGLFKKNEADVTGDCETLYSVSPLAAEWRRVLPDFAEDPIEITKSRNYDSCRRRVSYDTGAPEDDEFIKHTSESRIFAGKQGTIYKSETLSTVLVNPLLFGKQKAEVYSYVNFYLAAVKDVGAEWKLSEEVRKINSLLYKIDENLAIEYDEKNVALAQKLLQEITPLLQDPSSLSSTEFLAKFDNLLRLTNSLNSEQFSQLTSSIEVAKSSKNAAKNNMWILYRDAVAQTGTFAAFKEIKSWILNKKIEGEEAAEVIASIAGILRNPNEELYNEFFLLATNPIVVEQKFLNVSTLFAATKFIRLAKADSFVVDRVIPVASKDLKQAITDGDDSKAQVYIRALGNLAHPAILKVFAPYLDGRIPVSNYLRTQIVISLKTLANEKNDQVRAVLFSILKNTAESYEVRVAAALNIFLAFPTPEMFQILAHMTNDDPSTQVRAVLASSISFILGLKDPRFKELVEAAESAKNVVSKEKFGYRYSTDSLIDAYTSDDELTYFRELSFIGSENSILPKYQRAALRLKSNGWTEENWVTYSISDVQELVNYIADLLVVSRNVDADFKFSAKKIIDLLNIKRKDRSPLEGALFLDNLNQQRFFTFNEQQLTSFIEYIVKNIEQLTVNGINAQYIKVLTDKQVYVTFPLAFGVPFVYTYSEPILFIVQGQGSFKLDSGAASGSVNNKLTVTYARNENGRVGFVDTLGDVFTSSGIINKLQVYIPIEANSASKSGSLKLSFKLPEKDANLIHLSVTPYIAQQKLSSYEVVTKDPSTKIIARPDKVLSLDEKFGGLHLQGYSYSADYKNPSLNLFDGDIIANVRDLLYQKDIALTEFDLKYVAKESKTKAISFSLFFDTFYNQKESGEVGPAAIITEVAANSEARRAQFVKRVASGIESAEVLLVDLSAVFEGEQNTEIVFTGAYATSFVDNKIQALFFLRGVEQINAVFKLTKPKVTPLNFEDALKNPIKVNYEVDFKYGNDDNIKINGFGERTEEYTRKLRNDPLAKQCLRDSSYKNFYQRDCHKAIIKAHAPDYFKATVTYKEVSPAFLSLSYETYKILKELYSWEEDEDLVNTIKDGKIEIESKAFYYQNYANFKFSSKYGVLNLKNVEGMRYYPYFISFYAPTTAWERSRNWFTGYQHLPYCAVDDNKVWTYSGRSYEYGLTSSWHVVMVDESGLVVLARRPSDNQEEVYISYQSSSGKYLELDIKPSGVQVKSNTNKVSDGALTSYWDDTQDAPLLEYYSLAEGVLVFDINEGALRVVYDNQRLVLFTDGFRSTTNGLCGKSSSQVDDDYLTPFGLVDQPAYYGAAFSLDGEFSDAKTAELKKEAKLKAYQPVTKYTNILRSDDEWSKLQNESVKAL